MSLADGAAPIETAREPNVQPAVSSLAAAMPNWERGAIVAILVLAAGLRLWGIAENGFGNGYYAAAVRSMLVSPGNFFFGAYDPAGLVTVDKPPLALWVQASFAKVLGYRPMSLLLPQALIGVACVAVLYLQIRRVFGAAAGLTAACVLAVTPVAVAVDRDNLPDTLLTFLLLLAAGAVCRAVETGRWRWLLSMAALVGAAFNVKMLAAYVVLPTFYAVYLFAAPAGLWKRIGQLSIATGVLALVSLSWAILVDLTPKEHRPFIGSSESNSAIDLAIRYNGIGRILGGKGNIPRLRRPAQPVTVGGDTHPVGPPPPTAPKISVRSLLGAPGNPGLLRFAGSTIAEQISWLLPLTLFGGLAGLVMAGRPRPATSRHVMIAVYAGWLASYWAVFSFARGIFHDYYVVVMGPAIAALVGIGLPALWQTAQTHGWRRTLLPAALLATGGWQTWLLYQHGALRQEFIPFVLGGTCLGTAAVVAGSSLSRRWPTVTWRELGFELGAAACLFAPATWSFTTVMWPGSGMFPSANAAVLTRAATRQQMMVMRKEIPTERVHRLMEFLHANTAGETYLVATPNSFDASPIIIHSGEAVIAFGGFRGADQIFTMDQFLDLVRNGRLRFVLLGEETVDKTAPAKTAAKHPADATAAANAPPAPLHPGNKGIVEWVRQHGQLVQPELWQFDSSRSSNTVGQLGLGPLGSHSRLYDLKSAVQTAEKR